MTHPEPSPPVGRAEQFVSTAQAGYGYATPGPFVPPPSGVKFWGLGLLWFVPFFGALVAPILLGIFATQNRRHPIPVVRENARWAANWILTLTLGVTVATMLIVVNILNSGVGDAAPSALFLIANVLIWVLGIAHLVVSIVGMWRAKNCVVNPRIAIRFIPAA